MDARLFNVFIEINEHFGEIKQNFKTLRNLRTQAKKIGLNIDISYWIHQNIKLREKRKEERNEIVKQIISQNKDSLYLYWCPTCKGNHCLYIESYDSWDDAIMDVYKCFKCKSKITRGDRYD